MFFDLKILASVSSNDDINSGYVPCIELYANVTAYEHTADDVLAADMLGLQLLLTHSAAVK
jgi:hypothetical protein